MNKALLSTKRILSIAVISTLIAGVFAFSSNEVSAAAKLKVTPASKTIYAGKTVTLKSNKNTKWLVVKGKSYIKVVSKNGNSLKIKGIKKGTAVIRAKAGKSYKNVKVVVKPLPAPTRITVKADKTRIRINNRCHVSVKSVTPAVADKAVAYSSSNEAIAVVDKKTGEVIGKGSGRVDIIATSTLNKKVSDRITICVEGVIEQLITENIDLTDKAYPPGKVARVWVPIPETRSEWNTTIANVKYTVDGNPKVSRRYRDSAGNKVWYIEWDENTEPANRKASVTYSMEVISTVCDANLAKQEKGTINKSQFESELEETMMSGSITEGEVKELADEIVKEARARTVYDKAYAIYSWMTENLYKDDYSDNVGTGDVLGILHDGTAVGCQDINAVFTALCNAEGIPAREVYGLKLTNANGIPTAKCHAEFYLPGYGWVPCDAYDALKAIMKAEDEYRGVNAEKAADWKQIKAKYWAYREEGWMPIATGRDITLNPNVIALIDDYIISGNRDTFTIRDGKLNMFMNPYGEYDGTPLTNIKASARFYNYGQEDSQDSCGC